MTSDLVDWRVVVLRSLISKYITHRDTNLLSISNTRPVPSNQDNPTTRNICTDPPRSVATKYLEVPAPDDPLAPISIAARWASRDLYGEDMPGVAADLLEKGLDTSSLRRLAGELQVHNRDAIEALVGAMFRELGVAYPLLEQTAKLIASRQIAREVIAGIRNAWTAANHLEIALWNRIPETPELEAIFAINDEVDWDIPYGRSLSELDEALYAEFAKLAVTSIDSTDSQFISKEES